MTDGLYTRHEVACIIAELFGGTCACDYSGNAVMMSGCRNTASLLTRYALIQLVLLVGNSI